jgi:hypothetical protein
VLVGAVAILIATLALFVPYLTRDREVIESTPSVRPLPPGGLVPITLRKGDELCVPNLPLTPQSERVRFPVTTVGGSGPPLVVSLQAPGFRSSTRVPADWHDGDLDVALHPPPRPVRGALCIRNEELRPASVMGTQPGQKFARPTPELNGGQLLQDIPITFHRRASASLASRTADVIDHAAVFSPIPTTLLWVLLVLVILGVPALALAALATAVREDA